MTDYEIYRQYIQYSDSRRKSAGILDILSNAIYSELNHRLDVSVFHQDILHILRAIEIDKIIKNSSVPIGTGSRSNKEGFIVGEFVSQSIDEVVKAIEMKGFL